MKLALYLNNQGPAGDTRYLLNTYVCNSSYYYVVRLIVERNSSFFGIFFLLYFLLQTLKSLTNSWGILPQTPSYRGDSPPKPPILVVLTTIMCN